MALSSGTSRYRSAPSASRQFNSVSESAMTVEARCESSILARSAAYAHRRAMRFWSLSPIAVVRLKFACSQG